MSVLQNVIRGSAMAAILMGLGGVSTVTALETTNLVKKAVAPIANVSRYEGSTAWVGVEKCRDLVENNRELTFRFETEHDTTVGEGETALFDRATTFSVARGEETSVSCTAEGACSDIEPATHTDKSIGIKVRFKALTGINTVEECDEGIDEEFIVRIYLRADSSTTTWQKSEARLIVDTIRPDPPTEVTAVATKDTLLVRWTESASDDVQHYELVFSTTSFEGGVLPSATNLTPQPMTGLRDGQGERQVSLEPGATVYVAVVAKDEAENFSVLSNATGTEVIKTIDFWEGYLGAGGQEQGGHCAVSSSNTPTHPGPIWLLILGMLGAFGLRRRHSNKNKAVATKHSAVLGAVIGAGLLLSMTLTSGEAHAQSPIFGTAEVKLGGYYPAIDDEFEASPGPYETYFGSHMWMGELELDIYLWQGFGKLGLGLHAGYGSITAGAVAETDEDVSGLRDSTKLRLIPLRVSAVYRYDYSAMNHGIPLVPVIKGGLNYYFWNIDDPSGDTAVANGQTASGGKPGWHVSLGLHFLLNVLDPASAASFDMNWGVNHTYIFAEYTMAKVDGFGDGGFDFSDNYWMFGLAFEF